MNECIIYGRICSSFVDVYGVCVRWLDWVLGLESECRINCCFEEL